MIIDASLVFSDAQAVTATAASDSYADTLAAGNSYEGSWVVVRVDTAFTAAGAATLTIDLQTDDNTSFSSPTTLCSLPGGAIAVASLIAGFTRKIRIPLGAERYLRGNYTVATGPMTAGKIDLFITNDIDSTIG